MTDAAHKIKLIKNQIVAYPDFPRPGTKFLDIFPVLRKPECFGALRDLFFAHCSKYLNTSKVTAICAIECRGFLFGPVLSLQFGIPFVPIRKQGKLPGEKTTISYNMEYGTNTLEIQRSALPPGSNVLIVDDVIASGGTLAAGCQLIQALGSKVDHCLVIMEIEELEGQKNLPCPLYSLFKV